jgi:hypothetical protein
MDLQFHLDESVNSAVGNGLWLRGIGVTTSKVAAYEPKRVGHG